MIEHTAILLHKFLANGTVAIKLYFIRIFELILYMFSSFRDILVSK